MGRGLAKLFRSVAVLPLWVVLFTALWWAAGTGRATAASVVIAWQAVTEDTNGHLETFPVYYQIYCDTIPAFTPGAANFLAATTTNIFVHTDDRLGNPNQNLFYLVRATDIWGNQSAVSDTTGEVPYVLTRVRAFLQAPYDAAGDSMRTGLARHGMVPASSPYPQAPRAVKALPAGTVDWVLLQLRDPACATIVAQESFLLDRHGNLTEPDGLRRDLGLTGALPGAYELILRHRNHVAVISDSSYFFDEREPLLLDMTVDPAFCRGPNSTLELESGIRGLWSGDVNRDDQVSDLDYSAWRSAAEAGRHGYQASDLDFDGAVTSRDYVVWYRAHRLGVASYVP